MKNKLLIFMAAILSVGITACGPTNPSVSETQPSVEEKDDKYYKLPEGYAPISMHVSTSGDAIDISAGKEFVTGIEYTLKFPSFYEPSCDDTNGSSSNEEVFTATKVDMNTYTVNPIHEGDAYITIIDSNGLVRWRQIIKVRDAIPADEMDDYLINIDSWQSVVGDRLTLTFLLDHEVLIEGTVVGSEILNLRYVGKYKFVKLSDDKRDYIFEFTDDQSKASYFAGFNIAVNGDFLYVMDRSGTDAICVPSNRVNEY